MFGKKGAVCLPEKEKTQRTWVHSWKKVVLAFGEVYGTPLQYSCLENPMDGGAWEAAVHGVAKSWTRLSDFTLTFHFPALEKEMATVYGVTESDTTEVT